MTPHAPYSHYLERLARAMTRQVTAEELDWLVVALGLEGVARETRRARARGAVAAAWRAGRMEELRGALRGLRPCVRWPRPPGTRGRRGEAAAGAVTVYQIGEVNTGGGAFFGGEVSAGGDVGVASKG